eukprot:CAMPEP_0119069500 /NCGR_PEP_ID=MMETSP1178-20130426/19650_1 /TAXON_ID=33656 /ORGANISM="unid sp, Strain CCMP2000" /LENGTH=167 /DNA_ID=CAMNT_0007051269 /DNA_START=21 /DNA_END=524 /DNA_ORIENTATION=+
MPDTLPDKTAAMLKEAFEIYDALSVEKKEKEKKDGLVTEHHLGYILRSIGQNPTEAQVKQFFAKYAKGDKIDLDGANKAGADMFEAMAGVDHAKALEEAFTVFDQRAQDTGALTGNVSSGEVRHIISNLGIDNLTEEELDELIAEVDPQGSGVISYKEFVKKIFAPA